MDNKPELYGDLFWVWEAYCTLDNCRSAGFAGANPIAFDQMQAMANELRLKDPELRKRFFGRIKILDREYMAFFDKKTNTKTKKK